MSADPQVLTTDSGGWAATARRPWLTLVVATIGFAATFWAWVLFASLVPELAYQFELEWVPLGILIMVPLASGAVGQFVVGVLTDYYGARLTLTAVAAITALPLAAATFVTTVPVLIAVALAFGFAGTTFAVGITLVSHSYSQRQRGWALGVYGAGMLGATAAGLSSPYMNYLHEHRRLFVLAALALVGFAATAAIVIRDRPLPGAERAVGRAALAALRMPVVPRLATLSAVALGTLIAITMFLPAYLRAEYRLDWDQAMLLTDACIGAAALVLPVGGALADREPSAFVLAGGFTLAGACALVQAFAPPLPAAALFLVGMATGLGTASGALLALIGINTPPERVGAVAGAVGAAAGLGALVPPLLLTGVYTIDGSFAIGTTILSALLLAAATVRADGLTSAERQELAQLREENRQLRHHNALDQGAGIDSSVLY